MTQPVHHLGDGGKAWSFGQGRSAYHDDRQAERAGGSQFGIRARPTGILGNDDINVVICQQSKIVVEPEGSARNHDGRLRQQGFGRWIDKPQQIVVLRRGFEQMQVLTADRQKDVHGGGRQRLHRVINSLHDVPHVTLFRLPRRAFQRGKGQGQGLASHGGVMTHLRGKGVGGVDDMGDVLVAQIADQARNAAKTADPLGQGLCYGFGCTTGIGKDRVATGRGKCAGQQAGFGGAAQQKDAVHG